MEMHSIARVALDDGQEAAADNLLYCKWIISIINWTVVLELNWPSDVYVFGESVQPLI